MAVETRIESDGRRRKVPEGPSPIPGWDIAYDHTSGPDPHLVIRQGEGAGTRWALACPWHREYTPVPTQNAERALRRQGRAAWCPGCAAGRPHPSDA
ncbi:hypothetical protein [Streptomyces sp. NPDC018031]|uniref:hypothetical protein n=1 Tax=Streptomyces sp. NPDC018031 TaxID=3365033 RepID=UPI003797C3EE